MRRPRVRRAISKAATTDGPRRFHRQVVQAIKISGDLPREWADSPALARIACWQGAGFDTGFRERGRAYYVWRGMFAMTVEEVETIFGRWMTAERGAGDRPLES
jgi:hypothetical protein